MPLVEKKWLLDQMLHEGNCHQLKQHCFPFVNVKCMCTANILRFTKLFSLSVDIKLIIEKILNS